MISSSKEGSLHYYDGLNENILEPHVDPNIRYFSCILCEDTFPSKNKLRVHLLNIHGIKHYCFECELAFGTVRGLRNHKACYHQKSYYDPKLEYKIVQKNTNIIEKERKKNLTKKLVNKGKFIELDLHDLYKQEALNYILRELKKYDFNTVFKIVHGYHHGIKLKVLVRSFFFVSCCKRENINFKYIDTKPKGHTIIMKLAKI